MRWIRLGSILVIALLVSVVTAQEDLGWLLNLIPTGADIDLEKQLDQGAITVVADDNLLVESFTALNAWQTNADREGNRRIRNERYEILVVDDGTIYTGLGDTEYDNIVVTVDTLRLSEEPNDGYGLVCRAQDDENGIHFFISSDGYWRIFAFVDGRARPFMPWTASELINTEPNATNQISAVCVNDYYALYINGVLAGEARDSTFTEGTIGMSVIVFEEDAQVSIAFDNLQVWSASSDETAVAVVETDESTSNSRIDEQRSETILLLGDGAEEVELNDLILYDTMDDPDNWLIINSAEGSNLFDDGFALLESDAGAQYPVHLITSEYYNNAVIQADITFEDGTDNNAFGITCRSSTTDLGRGFLLDISGDGYFIVWATDSADYRPLVDWERSSEIIINGTNRVTAVCVDDYMALYVNETLLVDFYADSYLTGTVGFNLFTFEEDDSSSITIDDVFIWSAELR